MTKAYHRPWPLFTAHLETVYPALFRKVSNVVYTRERIDTPDDDFLDIDWLRNNGSKLVIISHGLEGNTTRGYMKGMARAFFAKGYDVLTWNFRGCSEEMNRQLRFYHSGATEDLQRIVEHAMSKGYKDISLIGFSLGGNLTLKYLGERTPPEFIKRAVAISVPLDLYQSSLKISQRSNWIYSKRFLDNLKEKIIRKSKLLGRLDVAGIEHIKTLLSFDDCYTAPLHGFANAIEYYTHCSAMHYLNGITIPTLIVSASNDPFLSKSCYPAPGFITTSHVTFEETIHGGHVGFTQFNKNGLYWSEERALAFIIP
ncbi:MAG: alpha/beta fold hydrolase [Chryseolinea sp.]